MKKKLKRFMIHTGFLIVALCCSFFVNLALAPWLYVPDADDYYNPTMPKDVRGQLNYFYWIWDDQARIEKEHGKMREQNPEWDMISRTFFAYSLANVALGYPEEKERALHYLDIVIDDTLKHHWRKFLLPYGNQNYYKRQPASSVMVDGEFSLMIGLRRLIKDSPDYKYRKEHKRMIERCVASIEAGPVLCGECYPDECWLWCNPLALTSIRVYDILEGTDHSDLINRWAKMAKKKLIDKKTGLFQSAVTLKGEVIHPPEGSTIWIAPYCLEPILPELAESQYKQMKKQLGGDFLFFNFGLEWPRGTTGDWDIDSGYTPLGMGPASTGFAFVASKQMNDREFFEGLLAFIDLVGVPQYEDGKLRYLSSNLVGDATFLLGKTSGPAWDEIKKRSKEAGLVK